MESKEYVNPFIAVHRKAEALKKRAREEHNKDSELRETRLQEAARDLDVSAKWFDQLAFAALQVLPWSWQIRFELSWGERAATWFGR